MFWSSIKHFSNTCILFFKYLRTYDWIIYKLLIRYWISDIRIIILEYIERFWRFKSARNPSGDCPIHYRRVANHRLSGWSEHYGFFQILKKKMFFYRGGGPVPKDSVWLRLWLFVAVRSDQWLFAVSRPRDLVSPVVGDDWRHYSMASGMVHGVTQNQIQIIKRKTQKTSRARCSLLDVTPLKHHWLSRQTTSISLLSVLAKMRDSR